jgi:hypothetical protein
MSLRSDGVIRPSPYSGTHMPVNIDVAVYLVGRTKAQRRAGNEGHFRWAPSSANDSDRCATSIAGMAQRNPLVHYTKKIVADATENDDRRHGPKNEYGHVFIPLN